jgi:hypothetical protein
MKLGKPLYKYAMHSLKGSTLNISEISLKKEKNDARSCKRMRKRMACCTNSQKSVKRREIS